MQPSLNVGVAEDSGSREGSRVSSRQGSHTSRTRLVTDLAIQSTSAPASRRISRSSSAVEAPPSMGAAGLEAWAAAAAVVGMPEAGRNPSASRRTSQSSGAVQQGPLQGPVGSQTAAAGPVAGQSQSPSRQVGPSSSDVEQGPLGSHTTAVGPQAGTAAGTGEPKLGTPMSQDASSSQSAVAGPEPSGAAWLESAGGQWGSFVRRSRPQVSFPASPSTLCLAGDEHLNKVPGSSAC